MKTPYEKTAKRRANKNAWMQAHMKSLSGYSLLQPWNDYPVGTFFRWHRVTHLFYTIDDPHTQVPVPRDLLKNRVKWNIRKDNYIRLCTAAGFNL